MFKLMTLYAEHGQESVASCSSNSPSCVCIFLGKTFAHIIFNFSLSLVTLCSDHSDHRMLTIAAAASLLIAVGGVRGHSRCLSLIPRFPWHICCCGGATNFQAISENVSIYKTSKW